MSLITFPQTKWILLTLLYETCFGSYLENLRFTSHAPPPSPLIYHFFKPLFQTSYLPSSTKFLPNLPHRSLLFHIHSLLKNCNALLSVFPTPDKTSAQISQGFCSTKKPGVIGTPAHCGWQDLFPRARERRVAPMSLNLSVLRPENTGRQVHRSLPALLARKPGRPREAQCRPTALETLLQLMLKSGAPTI